MKSVTADWSSWESYLPRVSVGGALPMRFEYLEPGGDYPERARVEMVVPDVRDPSGETEIIISLTCDLPDCDDGEKLRFLQRQVHWMYRHEADEQLKLDDAPVVEMRPEH